MSIVEFMGMPAAGKSTQVKLLIPELDKKGLTYTLFSVEEVKLEDSDVNGDIHKFDEKINRVRRKRYNSWIKDTTNYLILDRGFYDNQVWGPTLYENGIISESQRDNLVRITREDVPEMDKVFLFLAPPVVSKSRRPEPREGVSIDNNGMNNDMLRVLYENYNTMYDNVPNLIKIDATQSIKYVHNIIMRELRLL